MYANALNIFYIASLGVTIVKSEIYYFERAGKCFIFYTVRIIFRSCLFKRYVVFFAVVYYIKKYNLY